MDFLEFNTLDMLIEYQSTWHLDKLFFYFSDGYAEIMPV